jgi:hypothetical protein
MESTMNYQKLPTTQLEDLPVEILLNVLNCLELPDRNRFGQVSKRLKGVSLVESLWQKILLLNETVSIKLVEKILDRGCKTLCLKSCKLTEAANLHSTFDKPLLGNQIKANEIPDSSQLINLDLYKCEFTDGFLETLLSSSHSLKTFSLTDYNICLFPNDILHNFYSQNGQTLQTLNLAFTSVVGWKHIELIVKNCPGLKEVDFSLCYLAYESIHLLVNGITKNIEKFGLAYCGSGKDYEDAWVKTLVSRCNKIKSLNLAWNSISDNSLTSINESLKNTLEELDIGRCRNITDTKLLEMGSMPKLKVLNYFKPWNSNYEYLKKNLPQLTNNNPKERLPERIIKLFDGQE